MQLTEEYPNRLSKLLSLTYSTIEKYLVNIISMVVSIQYGFFEVIKYEQEQDEGRIEVIIILIFIILYNLITLFVLWQKQQKLQIQTQVKMHVLLAICIFELYLAGDSKTYTFSIAFAFLILQKLSENIYDNKVFVIFTCLGFFYLLVRILLKEGFNFSSIQLVIQLFFWLFFSQFQSSTKIKLKIKCKSSIYRENYRVNLESLIIDKNQKKSKGFYEDFELGKSGNEGQQQEYQDAIQNLQKLQMDFDKNKMTLSQIIPFDSERFSMLNHSSKKIDHINENSIQSLILENIINEVSMGIIIIDSQQQIYYHNQQALTFFINCTKKNLKQKLFQWETNVKEQLIDTQTIQRKKSTEFTEKSQSRRQQTQKLIESKKVNANMRRSQSFGNYSVTNNSKLDEMLLSENKETFHQEMTSSKYSNFFPIKAQQNLLSNSNPMSPQFISISPPYMGDTSEIKRSFLQDNYLHGNSTDRSNLYNGSQQIDMLDQSKNHLTPNFYAKSSNKIYSSIIQREYNHFRKTDLQSNQKLISKLKNGKRLLFGEIISIMTDLQNYKATHQKPFRSDLLLEYKKNDDEQYSDEDNNAQGRSQTQFSFKTKQEEIDYSITNNILSIKMMDERGNHVMVYVKSYFCNEIEVKSSDLNINPFQKEKECVLITCEIVESGFMPADLIDIKQFNYFKKRILSSVSHELRTPLNCSIQLLDILQKSDILQEAQKKMFITPALNSNQMLLCMINDILDFAQIASGKLKLTFTTFNIIDTIRECLSYFTIQAAFKSISIDFTFDPQIPINIHSDPMRLKQVVINLMNNAVKFTNQGTISVCLDLVEKDIIKIQIIDTGCGISSDLGSQIFKGCEDNKKTYQDLGQALNTEGAGLGLTIANNIAMGLGGNRKIEYVSEMDVGSMFSFYVINRSKKTKGCYFNHLKLFSHSYSLWRSLQEQSREISDTLSHTSIEQQSIRKEWQQRTRVSSNQNSNLSNQHSRDSGMMNHPPFISQQDVLKYSGSNDQHSNRKQKTMIQQHLSPEDRKFPLFDRDNSEIKNDMNTDDNSSDEQSSSNNSQQSPQNIKSATKVNSEVNRNSSQILEPLSISKQQRVKTISDHELNPPSIVNHNKNYLFPNIEEEACNISSDNSIKYIQQNTINQNYFNVAHKKKRKQNLFIQTAKTKSRRPSLFNELERDQMKTQQLHIRQLQQTNSKRIRDSQLDNLQSDIYMFISNSSLQTTQQLISSPIKLNEEKLLQYNPNAQNRLKRFSTDPIAEGILKQLQMEINKDKFKRNINSNDNLSPIANNKQKDILNTHKAVSKMATISEETLTSITKGMMARGSISNDQRFQKKNVQTPSINNLNIVLPQIKQCECPKILIVDDNFFNLYALELRLKEYQYTVDKANSGFEAIEKVSDRLLNQASCCKFYSLIFMDIDMPLKNGYETTEEIIQFYKSNNQKACPISACTAYISDEDKQKAYSSGMTYYLTKPVLSEKLEEILNSVFNS